MGQRADEVGAAQRGEVAAPATTTEQVYVAEPTRPVGPNADAADYEAPAEPDPEQEVAEIRAEMEFTRREMSETIDAIQDRLSPDELKDQAGDLAHDVAEQVSAHVKQTLAEAADNAKHSVRQATIGRVEDMMGSARHSMRGANSSMLETIKQNPLPTALVGLGLGWLFMNRAEPEPRYRSDNYQRGGTYHRGYDDRSPYGYGYPYGRGAYAATDLQPADYEQRDESAMRMAQRRLGDAADTVGERAGEMAEQMGEFAGHAGETARDAGSGLLDTIRENPVPAALAGIGLAWLFMGRSGGRPRTRPLYDYPEYRGRPRYDRLADYEWDGIDADESERRGFTQGVANGVGRAGERVGEAASMAQERVGEFADEAQERMSHLASDVGDLASSGFERMQRAPGSLERLVQENPIAVGVAGFALGALVGLALPETEREQELMGETRGRFVERAQEMAQDTAEKVQQVVDKAGSAATREAEKQGIAPSS